MYVKQPNSVSLSPSHSLHCVRGEMQAGVIHDNEKGLEKILRIFVQLRIKIYCIADVTMVTTCKCVTYQYLYDAGCQIASSSLKGTVLNLQQV